MLPVLDMCYALFIDDCGVFVCLGMKFGVMCFGLIFDVSDYFSIVLGLFLN